MVGGEDQSLRVWDAEKGSLLFLTVLGPYLEEKSNVPPQFGRVRAVLHPAGRQALVKVVGPEKVGRVFDLPYESFEDVIEAAYAAVPHRLTDDERAALELDLFGKPDPKAANIEELTRKMPE